MSRAERRAHHGRKKTGRDQDFRAPTGCCALTIDFVGLTPSSFAIENVKLADVLQGLDGFAANRTYAEVLSLFGAAFRRLKAGHDDAANACLVAWWLAFRHPAAGPAMVRAVSLMMVRGEPVHVTLHVGASGHGLTMALSDRFVDLDRVAEHAMAAKRGVSVFDLTTDRTRETRH
jgi:hypothetical protein